MKKVNKEIKAKQYFTAIALLMARNLAEPELKEGRHC
jgi:hypothetical protein